MTRAATQPRSLLQDLQRVCVVGLSVAALVHATLDVDVPLVVAIHSFTAWLYVLAWPLGVAAAVQRRWGRAAVCGVLVAAHLWWVMPRGGGGERRCAVCSWRCTCGG
ncbi:MAG: hypothetical protein KTR31_25295 [Myxococcales bacterium]|nr:hypothetical protein [Myxococcales bacterium]